jgi:hypothetical protein
MTDSWTQPLAAKVWSALMSCPRKSLTMLASAVGSNATTNATSATVTPNAVW